MFLLHKLVARELKWEGAARYCRKPAMSNPGQFDRMSARSSVCIDSAGFDQAQCSGPFLISIVARVASLIR